MSEQKKEKILIVDDVEANRMVLKDIISQMGYQPLLAENGVQALKIVERFFPQLIISDIAMPQMDGLELCERLKRDPRTRDIPILFLSAYADASDVVKGFEIGGVDYIVKPFLPEVVKARISLHLKLYETQQELSKSNRMLQTSVKEQLKMLEQEKKNVLYALVRVARENDAFGSEHLERMCYNCHVLSEALQLTPEYGSKISDDYVEALALAAPLCDLGNVGIPKEVLQKVDPLEEQDLDLIRRHTIIGGNIIDDVQKTGEYNEFLKMSYDIARFHHEYYDGSGYPEGRKGDEIPLAAQIVSVVSAYCAITEKRVYRDAFSREEAIEMINKQSGIKFNPRICEVLAMIYRQLH